MDWKDRKNTLMALLKKYRWAAAVLAAGLLLMCVPTGGKPEEAPATPVMPETEQTLQQELEQLLSRLEGAGKVQLVLSVDTGARSYYQTDEDLSANGESSDRRQETVLVTAADRSQSGLLLRRDPPRYLGAVVLCQGADSASVRLAVVDAVATATGLTSDKIAVWKMK